MPLLGLKSPFVSSRTGPLLLVIAAILAASGCGPSVGDVSGTVTYKDKPLKFGSVTIESSTGEPAQGIIKEDGTYSIQKVPTGEGKVGVVSRDDLAVAEYAKAISAQGRGKDKDKAKPALPPLPKSQIPDKYNAAATSGLTINVTSPSTKHDIMLK